MMNNDQKYQALFYQLIMSFQAASMQHLGQMENMFTKKIEKDLEQAHVSIDMIEMIRQKTEGNRSDEETQFIDNVLRELKRLRNKKDRQKTKPITAALIVGALGGIINRKTAIAIMQIIDRLRFIRPVVLHSHQIIPIKIISVQVMKPVDVYLDPSTRTTSKPNTNRKNLPLPKTSTISFRTCFRFLGFSEVLSTVGSL